MDDALVKSKHQNKLRITRVSPFVLSYANQLGYDTTNFDGITQMSSYLSNMFQFQISNSLSEMLNRIKYDFFCVDFLDVWKPIVEFVFQDNTRLRITQSEILDRNEKNIVVKLEEVHGKIMKRKILEPIKWDRIQLEIEINQFVDWLTSTNIAKSGKLLVLETYLPYQKIEKNKIVFLNDVVSIGAKNNLIRTCIDLLKERIIDCITIPKVDIFVGNANCSEKEPENYIEEYYSYLLKNIKEKFAGKKNYQIHWDYMNKLQLKIDKIHFPQIMEEYKKIGKDRSIILFGSSALLEEYPEFAKSVQAVIPYLYELPIDEKFLATIRDKSEEYVLVFPHLFSQDDMLKKLFVLGYTYPLDIITPQHDTISLAQFEGVYSDVYHNFVTVNRAIILHLQGNAAFVKVGNGTLQPYRISAGVYEQTKLVIEDNVRPDRLSIGLNPGAQLFIGKDTTFAECNMIRATYLSNIFIDKDCMFSSNVFIYSGDGHNIYDSQTGECINFTKTMIDTSKTTIHLRGHVWIGYEAVLLAGADIGAGSIVGARSMVKGKYSNNSVIVGSPAKTVKKNIGWTREPFVTDIFSEQSGVDHEFLKKTVEGDM